MNGILFVEFKSPLLWIIIVNRFQCKCFLVLMKTVVQLLLWIILEWPPLCWSGSRNLKDSQRGISNLNTFHQQKWLKTGVEGQNCNGVHLFFDQTVSDLYLNNFRIFYSGTFFCMAVCVFNISDIWACFVNERHAILQKCKILKKVLYGHYISNDVQKLGITRGN